jgi:hypothetical protein
MKIKTPVAPIVLLILLGTASFSFAFWLVDHRQAIPYSGNIMAALMLVFFVTYTSALILYLGWRDKKRAAIVSTPEHFHPKLEGTVYGLEPGCAYRVMKSFTDYYGNSFQRGELLHFKERHFLPYDGGHTIMFVERALYLQEDQNREILENFSEYITSV